MFRIIRLVLPGLLLLVLLPSVSRGMMIGLSVKELSDRADTVIVGKVTDKEVFWSADGKMIMTAVLIEVSEVIKGVMGDQHVTVEYRGGEIGEIGMKVSDVPTFQTDETVLVFLKAVQSGRFQSDDTEAREHPVFHLVGKAQGKYSIATDGIARRSGFSLVEGGKALVNEVPMETLIRMIKKGE